MKQKGPVVWPDTRMTTPRHVSQPLSDQMDGIQQLPAVIIDHCCSTAHDGRTRQCCKRLETRLFKRLSRAEQWLTRVPCVPLPRPRSLDHRCTHESNVSFINLCLLCRRDVRRNLSCVINNPHVVHSYCVFQSTQLLFIIPDGRPVRLLRAAVPQAGSRLALCHRAHPQSRGRAARG